MSALAAAMLAYAERIAPPTTQQRRNLQRLAGGAQAVVAGQQAGLLTGPAYAVHKAADAALLAAAGLGVAMGNAQPEAKAAARAVTGRNTDGGAAAAIRRWLL